ncbi:MAG: class I SAM-dependent methyltransferase [bacterium]
MALYDRYSDVILGQAPFVQRMERYRQDRIVDFATRHLNTSPGVRAVEVGVGIGLFAEACKARGWNYTGVDRNQKMLDLLGTSFTVVNAEVPPMPAALAPGSFDLAYSSFVVEHLADGTKAFEFVSELERMVKPDGLIVLVVPDALSLGLEFWNLDYTHRYPTAERNMTHILLEAGLNIERIVRYNGPCFTGIPYWLTRIAGWFYSYRLWAALLRNKTLAYSVYQYVKQDILVFICRKVPPVARAAE